MDDGTAGPPVDSGRIEHPLSSSVLVLNKHYVALRVVTARRAFVLLFKECAEAIDSAGETFATYGFVAWLERSRVRQAGPVESEVFVRTPRMSLLVPK